MCFLFLCVICITIVSGRCSELRLHNRDYRSYLETYGKIKIYSRNNTNDTVLKMVEANTNSVEVVNITVFYETLCPASVQFFEQQLGPTAENLGRYVNIQLIPYGYAQTTWDSDGQYKFRCQHGPEECFGNMLHACVIKGLHNNTLSTILNSCLMRRHRYFTFKTSAILCGKQYGISLLSSWRCALSQNGRDLLKQYGDDTRLIRPRYVPHVLINGSSDSEDRALGNLWSVVCDSLRNTPRPCSMHTGNK